MCVFSSHLFWTSSSLDVYQPGLHRRKVTQDFSSTFLLRCMPLFFSREGFSRSFPSTKIVLHLLGIFFFFSQVPTCQRLRGYLLSYRGDRLSYSTLLYEYYLKKNLNASRPSEHPPVQGNNCQTKRLGGIIGCKDKISSWHLNGFADGSNIGSTV